MDYIKISLIGLIAVIVYYLALQWSGLPNEEIKLEVTENENISTVFLNGEIDMDIADNVREVIFPLIDAGKEVHLNLKDVQYMDSSGISVLVESNQRAKEKNTKVELKEVSQPVEKVLAMARKFL